MQHETDLIASYRRLTAIYHDLLSHDDLDLLLERIADSVEELVPCDSLFIAELDPGHDVLVPLLARGTWSGSILRLRPRLGEGLIGWAAANALPVLSNDALHDARAGHVAGTPASDPEAIISLPLIARGNVVGAMSMYRVAFGNTFSDEEFELAQRFGDAATLALVNFKTRRSLAEQASTDDLTAVLNRRGFFDVACRALVRAGTYPSALLLVDLDEFKSVNDSCGHDVGDDVLKHVTRQLAAVVRAGDVVARLGGDEFAVLLPRTMTEDAAAVADHICDALERAPFIGPKGRLPIAASVGYAVTQISERTDLDALLVAADAQMYEAKRARAVSAADDLSRSR